MRRGKVDRGMWVVRLILDYLSVYGILDFPVEADELIHHARIAGLYDQC